MEGNVRWLCGQLRELHDKVHRPIFMNSNRFIHLIESRSADDWRCCWLHKIRLKKVNIFVIPAFSSLFACIFKFISNSTSRAFLYCSECLFCSQVFMRRDTKHTHTPKTAYLNFCFFSAIHRVNILYVFSPFSDSL